MIIVTVTWVKRKFVSVVQFKVWYIANTKGACVMCYNRAGGSKFISIGQAMPIFIHKIILIAN